ncbi:response regulator transcription factor [Shewanella sp.]|uniref:response regulator transcription factor n=1 Tax=Shewanella sp. TaxID=50422 RepID=UPI003561836F
MGSAVSPTLLLIEDDLPLAELICTFLENNGFKLLHASSVEAAFKLLPGKTVSLVICDVMLPGQDGFSAFPKLSRIVAAPIIFMTALADNEDEIRGLELGAADYISKPVAPALLLARIKARLKSTAKDDNQIWQRQDLILHKAHQQLCFADKNYPLTTQETDLMWVFVHHLDQVLSREYLFEQIIGRDYDGLDRAMDLKISRLRRKLEKITIPGLSIRTVHGRGYLLSVNMDEMQ